jgi:hypothetical protein
MTALAAFEEIIDISGVAPRIEALLPIGVRPRQLNVRTLLAGMCLAQADHRPAHLTRVHQTLTSLPGDEQRRLGITTEWKHGPHVLTYRQTERTFGLVTTALSKDEPDGLPSGPLQGICDALLEASIPAQFTGASTSLAVDWTDMDSFSRPRRPGAGPAPTPKHPGATARTTCCAAKTSCSTGGTCPPGSWCPRRTGPPSPSSPAGPRCRRAGTTRSARSRPC